MAERDREHWDARYLELGVAPTDRVRPLPIFADHEDLFPTDGRALEVACGRGRGAVWLADRGMSVVGYDISPVAIGFARLLATDIGLAERCEFAVADFDDGLPEGEPVDLVLCHCFRQVDLDQAMLDRLEPGGMLAIAVLSEVGHGPGRFRAKPGELVRAFGGLDVAVHGEADGMAWLLGSQRS